MRILNQSGKVKAAIGLWLLVLLFGITIEVKGFQQYNGGPVVGVTLVTPVIPTTTPTLNLTVVTGTPTGSNTPTNTPTGTGTMTFTPTPPNQAVIVQNTVVVANSSPTPQLNTYDPVNASFWATNITMQNVLTTGTPTFTPVGTLVNTNTPTNTFTPNLTNTITPTPVFTATPIHAAIYSGANLVASGAIGNQMANGQNGIQSISNLYVYDAKSGFETILKGAVGTGGGVGTILPVDLRGVETTYRASFNLATNATDNWALFNPNASGVTMLITCIYMNFSASTPAFGAVTFTRRTTPDVYAGATVTPTPYGVSKSYTTDGAAGGVFIPWLAGPTPGTSDSDCFVYQAYYASSAASELLTTVAQSSNLVWPPQGYGGGNKSIALLPGQSFILKGTNPTGGNVLGTIEWIEY